MFSKLGVASRLSGGIHRVALSCRRQPITSTRSVSSCLSISPANPALRLNAHFRRALRRLATERKVQRRFARIAVVTGCSSFLFGMWHFNGRRAFAESLELLEPSVIGGAIPHPVGDKSSQTSKKKKAKSGEPLYPMLDATHQNRDHSAYETIKMFVASFTLVPLRLLSIGALFAAAYAFVRLSMIGMSQESKDALWSSHEPLSAWRRACFTPVQWIARAALLVCGVHWIDVKGHLDPNTTCLVANHVSFLDPLVFVSLVLPSFVAKQEVENVFVVGNASRALRCIMVDRTSRESRARTRSDIVDRINSTMDVAHGSPPLIIFPEGTTTNGRCLMPFKTGAFTASHAVQPVTIRYPFRHFNPAYTNSHDVCEPHPVTGKMVCRRELTQEIYVVYRMLCQFSNRVEVEFLPVYEPSEAERNDAQLYANNVRALMARRAGFELSKDTF